MRKDHYKINTTGMVSAHSVQGILKRSCSEQALDVSNKAMGNTHFLSRIIIPFLLILFIHTGLHAQPDPVLHRHLVTAADNNPELQARYFSYQAALQRSRAAAFLPDPEVSFGYLVYPSERMPAMITMEASVMQMLPWPGMLRGRSEGLEAHAEQSFIALQQARYELFLQVKSNYYQIYLAEQEIRLMQQQLELLGSMERIIQSGIEAGRGSMADWLRVQMEINDTRVEIEDMLDMQRSLKAEFNALLNLPFNTEVAVADTLHAVGLSPGIAIYDTILVRNPRLLSLEAERRAAESAARLARVESRPELGLGLQYMRMQMPAEVQTGMLMPMISARVPLYRGRYRAMNREMDFELQMIAAERVGMQNMLRSEAEMILSDYRGATRKIELLQQNVSLARQTYRILLDRYMVDRGGFDPILQIQEDLIRYQRQLQQAVVQQNTLVATLEMLMATDLRE